MRVALKGAERCVLSNTRGALKRAVDLYDSYVEDMARLCVLNAVLLEQPVKSSVVAGWLTKDNSTAYRELMVLHGRGYLSRKRVSGVILFSLTARGAKAHAEATKWFSAAQKELREVVGEDWEAMHRGLRKIRSIGLREPRLI